ncbi:hypothetical protein B5S31_g3245 [[Candida] boidinii]|nr:hypothetical protein B5S31_g3245 [[Candida] boidinii]
MEDIKILGPFRDLPAPRHILDDNQFDDRDPLNEIPIVLPDITINHSGKNEECDYLFIVPIKLESIVSPLISNSELFAEIKISNLNNLNDKIDTEQQEYYDDEEQLYKISDTEKSTNILNKYEQDIINIYKLKLNKLIIHIIIIPIFKNKIIYNLISRKLIATLLFKKILIIGTSELNNGFETLNLIKSENFKIDNENGDANIGLINQLPQMKPPHLVTGISGSILSMCAMFHLSSLGIIIDAEGAFNLDAEKCNNDSLIDCAMVLNDYFKIGDDYIKQVEKAILKTKGSSGLYI